jgi:tetratricopeptide (TPR) repeat protein
VDAPVLGLVGTDDAMHFTEGWVESRLAAAPALRAELKRLALADSLRVFGNFVEVQTLAHEADVMNTDDAPVVAFEAPGFTFAKGSTPYGRLLKLIADDAPSSAMPALDASDAFRARLETYVTARNVYLHGLAADYEGRRDEAIAAYVESARLSEDFTLGYAQCLTVASMLAQSDPEKARALLRRLIEARPTHPVAKEFLNRLESNGQR